MRTEGLARPASQGGTKAYHSGWPTEQTRWQQTCKDAKGGGEKPTSFGLMVIWYLPNGGKKRGDEVTGGKEFQPAWPRGEGSEGIWVIPPYDHGQIRGEIWGGHCPGTGTGGESGRWAQSEVPPRLAAWQGKRGDLGHPSLGPRANPGRELGGRPSRLRRGKRKWPMGSERSGAHLTNTQLGSRGCSSG